MKKEVNFLTIIVLLILVGGMTIAATIDPSVEKALSNSSEVSVIVLLKDDENTQARKIVPSDSSGIKEWYIEARKEEVKKQQEEVLGKLDVLQADSGQNDANETEDMDFRLKRKFATINGFYGNVTEEGLEKLRNDPDVEKIYYDYEVRIDLSVSVPQINANRTWELIYNNTNINGQGETICIVDTGIQYTHPALGGCNQTTDINDGSCSKVIGGYDYYNGDSNPIDDNGHGTHCAGIAAGENETYRGVAPGAKLVAVKVLSSSGSGSTGDVASGIDWCVSNASKLNISVISMSLSLRYPGGKEYTFNSPCDGNDAVVNAANAAGAAGIFVVAAAGNDGNTSGIASPACGSNVTAIGGVNSNNNITYNRGSLLKLLAPGVSITSTYITSTFSTKSGTSMAAPHAAGAAALLFQYKKYESNVTLNRTQVESALNSTGYPLTDSSTGMVYYRIDPFAAILSLDTTPPQITFNEPTPTNNSNVNVSSAYINITINEFASAAILEFNGTNQTMSKTSSAKYYINQTNLSVGSYYFIVYANDSKNNMGVSTRIYFAVENNSAPTIGAPTLSPVPAYKTTINITCTNSSYIDPENDSVTWSYAWFNASGIISGSNNYVLNTSYAKNDNITCEITASDGNHFVKSNSTILTISNSKPSLIAWNASGSALNKTSTINISVAANDHDFDSPTYYFEFRDSDNITILQASSTSGLFNCSLNANCSKHDNITVVLRAYDGTEFSNNQSIVLNISDSPPISSSPQITPLAPNITTNVISCLNNSIIDVDNDNFTIYYRWYNDSGFTGITAANITNASFGKNQNITCEIIAYDGEVNGTAVNTTTTIKNAGPYFLVVSNITANETDLINANISVVDPDNDPITFNYSSPLNAAGFWNTTTSDSGNYTIQITASDGNITITTNITIVLQEAADIDNDGIPDANDNLIGNSSSITTNSTVLAVEVNGTSMLNQSFSGSLFVNISNSSFPLATFFWNFSLSTLDLRNITLNIQPENSTHGSTVVRGLSLLNGTKTIYIGRIGATYSSVCIRDEEVYDATNISSGCNQQNETFVVCNGSQVGSYNCTLSYNSTKYRITGLNHSAIKEQCKDNDLDNYGDNCQLGNDCNDNNAAINLSATEICGNGIDEDCSGADLACPSSNSPSGGGGGGSISSPKKNATNASIQGTAPENAMQNTTNSTNMSLILSETTAPLEKTENVPNAEQANEIKEEQSSTGIKTGKAAQVAADRRLISKRETWAAGIVIGLITIVLAAFMIRRTLSMRRYRR